MSRFTLALPGLRYLRELRQWSQVTLAHEAHMTFKTISDIEQGHHNADVSTAQALAKALGVTVAWLQYRWET